MKKVLLFVANHTFDNELQTNEKRMSKDAVFAGNTV